MKTARPMRWRFFVRCCCVVLVLISLCAIAFQYRVDLARANVSATNFLSYLSVVGDVYASAVLLLAALRPRASRLFESLRGMAVFYAATIGLLFGYLLAGIETGMLFWVDVVVHVVTPLALIVDWVVTPPRFPVTIRQGVLWQLPLVAYIVYTLWRATVVDWVPYPFFDGKNNGYGSVAAYSVSFFAFTTLIAAAVGATGNRLAARAAAS